MSLNDDDMRAYELLPPHNFDVVSVIAKKLEEVTPLEYVESRDGPAASELVYISGNGLVNMLNSMFGWNGWRNEVLGEHLETWQEGKHWVCCARVKVRLIVEQFGTWREDVGVDEKKDSNKGKAMENALKSAVTDGLKRAGTPTTPLTSSTPLRQLPRKLALQEVIRQQVRRHTQGTPTRSQEAGRRTKSSSRRRHTSSNHTSTSHRSTRSSTCTRTRTHTQGTTQDTASAHQAGSHQQEGNNHHQEASTQGNTLQAQDLILLERC